jgi:fatty-acyl-CoA synthase
VDRRDDLIVSGGENVYPAEIERVLLVHPMVRDAAVIGVPDATWGTRPVAIVVWAGDPAIAARELRAHCRSHLAGYKIPDRILTRDELPRSPSGKLLRRALRDEMLEEEPATD